jgi:hypothetical protein
MVVLRCPCQQKRSKTGESCGGSEATRNGSGCFSTICKRAKPTRRTSNIALGVVGSWSARPLI